MIRITMLVHVVDVAGAAVGENLVEGLYCSPLARPPEEEEEERRCQAPLHAGGQAGRQRRFVLPMVCAPGCCDPWGGRTRYGKYKPCGWFAPTPGSQGCCRRGSLLLLILEGSTSTAKPPLCGGGSQARSTPPPLVPPVKL